MKAFGVSDILVFIDTMKAHDSEGIKVDSSWTYTASFYYRFPAASAFRGSATIGLQSSTGQILASANVALSGSQTSWSRVQVTFRPTASTSSTSNSFFVILDGAQGAGQTINFAMFSLFPPTFKNRPNGIRADIAEVRFLLLRYMRDTNNIL